MAAPSNSETSCRTASVFFCIRTPQYIAARPRTTPGTLSADALVYERTPYAMLLLAPHRKPERTRARDPEEPTLKPILQQPILQQAAHLIRSQDPRIVGGIAAGVARHWRWHLVVHRLPPSLRRGDRAPPPRRTRPQRPHHRRRHPRRPHPLQRRQHLPHPRSPRLQLLRRRPHLQLRPGRLRPSQRGPRLPHRPARTGALRPAQSRQQHHRLRDLDRPLAAPQRRGGRRAACNETSGQAAYGT